MTNKQEENRQLVRVAGGHNTDGQLVELVRCPKTQQTAFVIGDEKSQEIGVETVLQNGRRAQPLSLDYNLIRHDVLCLPSAVEPYVDPSLLHASIQRFVLRYSDLDEDFASLCATYAMMSWQYERFDELPYLRIQGTFGTGKTRFLKVMGALCYRSLFASGASSVAPIFHSLDFLRGTLILDEADYRFTDERSEITKMLNNGNVKGFPILRCLKTKEGAFNPQAFRVYGPKIVATRGFYEDPALESRFITHKAHPRAKGSTVPITLPPEFHDEALSLRNQLLLYRFRTVSKARILPDLPAELSDRTAQIYLPLLATAPTSELRELIISYAHNSSALLLSYHKEPELQLLEAIQKQLLLAPVISIKSLSEDLSLPPRSVGHLVRSKLGLSTVKRQGCYVIPEIEGAKIAALLLRWGLSVEARASAENKSPAQGEEPVIKL